MKADSNLHVHIAPSAFDCPANLLVVFLHVSLPNECTCWTQANSSMRWASGCALSGRAETNTQEDMIDFGFSARHWQQIEKGRPITMKTLLRITIALDVPLSQLVRGLPRPLLTEK